MTVRNGLYLTAALLLLLAYCHSPKPGGDSTHDQWALLGFVKADRINPILSPGKGIFEDPVTHRKIAWEARNVFNPAMVVRHDTAFMLYRAQDSSLTSRIGLAWSTDGLHFTRFAQPVFYPSPDAFFNLEWPGGCEDPRVTEDAAGNYYMTYTAYDGKTARLCVAYSPDLLHWTKSGPAFAKAYDGRYRDAWSKSGSIVSEYTADGHIRAVKLGGYYWMYWGDQNIWIARSADLLHWEPLTMKPGEHPPVPLKGQALHMPDLQIAVPTRAGKFDADLVESGPPAILTKTGILLIYNSRNLRAEGDTSLPDGTYTAGQVWMDPQHPEKILDRLDHNFLHPDQPYELAGEVNRVCFAEGLIRFKHQWFLYYGTADSKIAVAVKNE
ncbi:MAG TPA: glycoside hydrolase family 130 protein [Sediminibacterium sp.]|nr:glycoside hydrolase family 130 protein [Sediminibacterium sp.]